jgi:hypothetical protein
MAKTTNALLVALLRSALTAKLSAHVVRLLDVLVDVAALQMRVLLWGAM